MQPQEKQEAVGEYRINYVTAGNGAPLLMLHGSDHRESWKTWEPMLALADSFGVVIPDLVGYGGSTAPSETPDHRTQAHVVGDLLEKLGVKKADVLGAGWGGQIGLELALTRPDLVRAIVLISSSYDKEQLKPLQKLRKPTLIVYAEDDMVTQLKAGYLLRDAIGTSRLEVLDPVAKDPTHDFTISHKLQKFRTGQVLQLVKLFLTKPEAMVSEPPEMENELKGMALRKPVEKKEDGSSGTP